MQIFAIEADNKVYLREFSSAEALREHMKNLGNGTAEFDIIRPATAEEVERYLSDDYED
jgi:hypothetical protein